MGGGAVDMQIFLAIISQWPHAHAVAQYMTTIERICTAQDFPQIQLHVA